ncbi:MAG: hypothetical protein IKV86_06220 [Clostridia bacterium]|nr:hypothetical protein [Clostridia bacterium]
MATKKKNKKNIIIALIVVVVAAAIIAGYAIYKHVNSQVYSGDGMYYHQNDGTTLQFKEDNTFSYSEQTEENTTDVLKGKWAEKDNDIILTYESGTEFTFVKTEYGYLYRKDSIYRGKTSDEKLLNNLYVKEENGKVVETLYFANDGSFELSEGKTITSRGTYTRVDNILIVRRITAPDPYGKKIEIDERYLVLDNGITKNIYAKTPAENVAK